MIDERIERQAEIIISWLLRIGVATSATLVVVGMVLVFRHHPSYRSSPTDLTALTNASIEYPHTVRSVITAAVAGRGQGIAMLGLLLLIATPVLRVAVSILLFLHERDFRFVTITMTVLALLLLSFVLGAAGG